MNPQAKYLLHFSRHHSTERVNFVKALRFAPTADAAPTSGGLDKAPLCAPVFASSYGKNEEKKLGGAGARTTATSKSFILLYLNSVYTILSLRPYRSAERNRRKRRCAALRFEQMGEQTRKTRENSGFYLTAHSYCNTIIISRTALMKSANIHKRRGPGRPRLPKGEAKGRIVPIRFTADDLKAIAAKAKEKDQTISEWVRDTISAAIQ